MHTTTPPEAGALTLLLEVTAFIWAEADMLDHNELQNWLSLWDEGGLYIVPIDPTETDYENTLNYAYDDDHMRQKRVIRLNSGESIATTPKARTVRGVSRVRIISEMDGVVTVRAAQDLKEFRKDVLRQHTADVTYKLRRADGSFKLQRKVISLINSTDTLTSIGYIL